MIHRRHSLRTRLLWPLIAVAVLASIAVAVGAYALASRLAERDFTDRYNAIASALENNAFPLTRNVLKSVAGLTETDLMTARFDGTLIDTTLEVSDPAQVLSVINHSRLDGAGGEMIRVTVDSKSYRVATFRRTQSPAATPSQPPVAWVIVLFDEARLDAALTRAVVAPLITGLSTVALLTAITLWLTSKLIRRLSRMQQQVGLIAEGRFETALVPGAPDEIGLLAAAVNSMANQLQEMWRSLQQREGERFLHQLSIGLAHNLRNSLTGAKMAIEIHRKQAHLEDDQALAVALHEIGQTESYVQRLLLVAAGKQGEDKPARIRDCLNDVRISLEATAKHRAVAMSWTTEPSVGDRLVSDGPALIAALTNLVFNAIQVADHVTIHGKSLEHEQVCLEVIDNGPGPADEVRDTLFDPFVTTKSEGLGLGLPLVKRSAERLGGKVTWYRRDEQTVFALEVATSNAL